MDLAKLDNTLHALKFGVWTMHFLYLGIIGSPRFSLDTECKLMADIPEVSLVMIALYVIWKARKVIAQAQEKNASNVVVSD